MKTVILTVSALALTSCAAVKNINTAKLLEFGAHVLQEAAELNMNADEAKEAVDVAEASKKAEEKAAAEQAEAGVTPTAVITGGK